MSRVDLSEQEIEALTGLKQSAAQIRFLRDMLNLPVTTRANGKPLVWRRDIEREKKTVSNGPRWSKAA